MNHTDKVKVSFTCTRETINELIGVIEYYVAMTPDDEDIDQEQDALMIRSLLKIKSNLSKCYTNKAVL